MKIFTSEQVRRIDAYTIENEPVASIDLMERASRQIAAWLLETFEEGTRFAIFIGPGNNGGDGLAVARLLQEKNCLVDVYLVKISDKLSEDAQINLGHLSKVGGVNIVEIERGSSLPVPDRDAVILDSIFGSGLARGVSGLPAGVIAHLNDLPNLRIQLPRED